MSIDPRTQAQNLPEAAQWRVNDLRQRMATGAPAGTTDLSVNEFLLVDRAGFEPLGMVFGCSVYHMGLQYAAWNRNQELGTLTAALYNARELALSRMEAEAEALGAVGVVGVRLDIEFMRWGADIGEFTAVGTAVKAKDGTDWRSPNGAPFTSDLNGQDFYKLLAAGFRPLRLVVGNCVYHVAQQNYRQVMQQYQYNTEVAIFTQARYEARELAMSRMQAEADGVQATAVVGTRIENTSHLWQTHVTEFMSIGTAIMPMGGEHTLPAPQPVLGMDG